MPAECASAVFAAHALTLQWRDIPEAAREAARIFLLDTLAVGVAGVAAPFADAVLNTAIRGAAGRAPILGRSVVSAPGAAAMVNAYQIHAQEFDCVHEAAVLHPCSAVLGALVAVCPMGCPEGCPEDGSAVDGESFGAAMVAGIDIAVALGLAGQGDLTFFRPATAGIFGATAAVGRVRGLSPAALQAAFGHALCFASGTMQAHLEGTPGLALQVGQAARNAVLAVDLAQAGLPGAQGSIDGRWGYLALFERSAGMTPILDTFGRDFAVAALSHKPFPTGRAAHGGIAAVQRLRAEHGVAAGDIAHLRYVAPPLIARLVGRPATAGMSVNYARLCLPYLAAHAAHRGTVGLDAFSPEALADAAVLSLAARVHVEIDGNPDPAAFVPASLTAVLRDGREIAIGVSALPGSAAAPLDRVARLAKLRDCLNFAGLNWPADGLAARIDGLEDETDAGRVLALACAGPRETSRSELV